MFAIAIGIVIAIDGFLGSALSIPIPKAIAIAKKRLRNGTG
jgi:hypothetical protein